MSGSETEACHLLCRSLAGALLNDSENAGNGYKSRYDEQIFHLTDFLSSKLGSESVSGGTVSHFGILETAIITNTEYE
jgi:hypothetical protein